MKIDAVKCKKCKDIIYSRARHDFRRCQCGSTFVDGGFDYVRCGGDPLPEFVSINVDVEDESKVKEILYKDWASGSDRFGRVLDPAIIDSEKDD